MNATAAIEVERSGLCELVVDQGRPGYAHLGVPRGGAADPQALAAANRLVGNDRDAAGLEIAFNGPALRFPRGAVLAVTGARFTASRSSGVPVAWNETQVLQAGEVLDVGPALEGCRCWLAIRGGIEVPSVMGSRSTFLPSGFGGCRGRPLRKGDRLAIGSPAGAWRRLRAHAPAIFDLAGMRVLPGPQAGLFDDAGLAAFFSRSYQVTSASDRRGLRLQGPPLKAASGELPSQGVLPGAVQVPPDGQPIILGWDGPVTGGYPVIAGVISADWARLAQLRPGDVVRFTTIELDAARELAATDDWRFEELA